MTAAAVFYDVRYRIDGGDSDWTVERFPVGADIVLRGMVRGESYEIEIRAVAANGRTSTWVDCSTNVPATAREGAAALPVNAVGNRASVWDIDTDVTYNATDSSATISVSAGTLRIGAQAISYEASSGVVSGSASTTKTVFLYYDDPRLQGGARTLGITESFIESMSGNGRVAIISLEINFPTTGGSSSGGGNIGGGGGGGGTVSPPAAEP